MYVLSQGVDGKLSKILRADYAFRAVILNSGEHTVEFTYNPKSFLYGVLMALIGFALIVILTAKKKI